MSLQVTSSGTQHERIAALDGWRGIAILLVVIEHVVLAFQHRLTGQVATLGQHGVTIFFVLSGFLITGRLLGPGVSLRQFYLRRFFRLMPVAWSYLLVAWLVGLLYHVKMIWPIDIWSCIFFFRNYVGNVGLNTTAHYWSLSIEEQFYLVWPALLLLLGVRRARWFVAVAVAALYGYVSAHHSFYELHRLHTEVQADALLVGCFLAITLQSSAAKERFLVIAKWTAPACLLLVSYLIWTRGQMPTLAEDIALGIMIAGSSLASWPRVLTWTPLTWLGRISYSVYVWNLSITAVLRDAPKPIFFAALVIVPIISYYYIELPVQKIGARFLRKGEVPLRSLKQDEPVSKTLTPLKTDLELRDGVANGAYFGSKDTKNADSE